MTIEVPHTIKTQFGLRQADGAVETSGGRVVAPPVTLPPEGAGFDYSTLDKDVANEAHTVAARIKNRLIESVREIGRDLLAIRKKMPYGTFLSWLTAEFAMSERTAQNYMSAADFVANKSATIALLPPTILYELSRKTNDPETVKQLVEQFDAGIQPTMSMIRDKLAGAKAVTQKQVDIGRLKKAKEAEKQRRMEMDAQQLKWKEDQKAKAERVQNAAKFLVSKLGSGGVLELFRLLGDAEISSLGSAFHDGDFSRGSPRLLTEKQIEEKFGGAP